MLSEISGIPKTTFVDLSNEDDFRDLPQNLIDNINKMKKLYIVLTRILEIAGIILFLSCGIAAITMVDYGIVNGILIVFTFILVEDCCLKKFVH